MTTTMSIFTGIALMCVVLAVTEMVLDRRHRAKVKRAMAELGLRNPCDPKTKEDCRNG